MQSEAPVIHFAAGETMRGEQFDNLFQAPAMANASFL
jgi:hypothetical protein